MTDEQERLISLLEDAGFIPNLTMKPGTDELEQVSIEMNFRGAQMDLTFDSDFRLIRVGSDNFEEEDEDDG